MAAKIFRINYKSDFILTLNSDAGWETPFCIKFWTGAPSQAYFVGYDGTTYTHCTPVEGEPTKLTVQFDDHHLPIGDLKFQIGYHFTVADFPTSVEDEVLNQASVIIEVDDAPAQVMLDFNGETAPDIEFSLPAYANEAQRIANEEQRIENEQARISAESERISNEDARIAEEQVRVSQEAARVSEFAQLKEESQQATSDANAAAQLANEKAVLAQQKADYAETQGNYAKAQGDIAQADHQRAESNHTTAAADHNRAESDHTRAESDHTTAAADHNRAESDHTRAESDHTTAAADHTRAESDHEAVEVYVDSLGAFDISAYNATGGVLAKYADLTAALGTNGANIPDALRKGGMSVKFVLSSDNKYVQFFCTADEFTTDETKWQGVDDGPVANSRNLVESGGVKTLLRDTTLISSDAGSLIGSWVIDNTNVAFEGTSMNGVFTSLTAPNKPSTSRPYFRFQGFKSGSKYRLQLKVNINSSRFNNIGFIYTTVLNAPWSDYRMIDADSGRNADVYDGDSLDCIFVANSNKTYIAFSMNSFGIGDTVTISDFSISEVVQDIDELKEFKEFKEEVEKKFSEQPYFGYPKSAGYHVRHVVNTPTPSSVGSRYSIVYKVCSGSKLRCQSSWGYGIFASVYDSVDNALIGADDGHILQDISSYTKTPIEATINVDGYLRVGTKNAAGTAISDSDILEFEESLSLTILGSIINEEVVETNHRIDETNEAVAETSLMVTGSRKNYVIGKKYSDTGSLVYDPDYTAITELIPVDGGSTVTFSLGTSLLLFNANKTFDDYFSQKTDPRTVTLKNTSVFIGVSFPTSRLSNVSLVINGVNYPIVLLEDVPGAAEARGTSFDNSGTFLSAETAQEGIVELSEKFLLSSFVFGKMLTQSGALVDSADGGYCTEFIEVQPSQKIVFNTRTAGAGRVSIVAYNASKAAFNYYSQTEANRLVTLPGTSAYIRFNYDTSMLNQLLLTDSEGNSILPLDGMLNGNFVKYYDAEELGANNVQDAIKAVVKEVRNPVIDIVKMYKDKEYARNNLVFKSDFSCFFFSDVHGSANNINRIVTLAKAWSEYVDCIINGGDTILNNSGESITWYQNIVTAAGSDGIEILTAIGNHDAYTPQGSDGSLNSYNKYIKPTIDNVPNIVQPEDAGTVGKCYYYKDYNEKIRIIVLDAYSPNAYWDNDEEAWLVSVLADAKTNNLAVLCVTHVPPTEENFTRIPCTFNSVLSVGRWVISPEALNAVENFISDGGVFAGWLCGHTHYDVFGYPTGKQGQHMFATMSARYNYGPNGFDTPRSGDDKKIDYDSFNLVAVDTENSLFKVLRVGVNLDFKMHTKNVLVYDYANREVISNW